MRDLTAHSRRWFARGADASRAPRTRPAAVPDRGRRCATVSRELKTSDQSRRDCEPWRVADDLLACATLERQDLQLVLVAVDQPPEHEPTGGPRNEHVAVERLAIAGWFDRGAPDFVAGAILPDAGRDGHSDLPFIDARRNDDRRLARGDRAARAEHGSDLQLR